MLHCYTHSLCLRIEELNSAQAFRRVIDGSMMHCLGGFLRSDEPEFLIVWNRVKVQTFPMKGDVFHLLAVAVMLNNMLSLLSLILTFLCFDIRVFKLVG